MSERSYKKHTQCDYILSFKYSVVLEIESGELSISGALLKYGIQSRSTISRWLRKHSSYDLVTQKSRA